MEWVDMMEGWKENLCYCGEVSTNSNFGIAVVRG